MHHTEKYLLALYEQLDTLAPGKSIKIKPEWTQAQRERYIDAVKIYINDGHYNYELNSKMTLVRRLGRLPKEWL